MDGFESQRRGGVHPFLLEERVGDGADDDVMGPPGVRAPFEVIEAQLGLELLVLLLDGPALMDEGHEVAERGRSREVDEVVLGDARPVLGALAEQPDFRQRPRARPVVRRGHPHGGTGGGPFRLVGVVPGDPTPGGRGPRVGQRLDGDRQRRLRSERRAGPPLAGGRDDARRPPVGAPDKHGQRTGHAEAVGQLQAMQGGAEHGRIAVAGIAEDGGEVDTRRADLAQQGEGESPLLLQPHRVGHAGAGTPRGIAGPALGQVQRGAEQPGAGAGPEGRGHGDLAVPDFAQTARVLPRDADRVVALLGKAGVIEQQDATPFGHLRAQDAPHGGRRPGRVGDEMLETLVGRGVGQAREHRLHRLAGTIAQQPGDVVPERDGLRPMAEARRERRQPGHQALQHRSRIVVEHCEAAYRKRSKRTMSSKVITARSTNEAGDLTK